MINSRKRVGLLIALGICCTSLLSVANASAQQAPASEVAQESVLRQEDLDADGQPDLTIIAASFATPQDRVYVYDNGHNMRRGSDWHTVTDFEDDTWVFDRSGDGTAQLVVSFLRSGSTVTASIFVDQNGDEVVSTVVSGSTIHVTESKFPAIHVEADGGWFLPNQQLNWNVRFRSDGAVVHLHTYELTEVWNRYLKFDGTPDIELEFRDVDRDGIPEYGLWRLLNTALKSDGAVRTWIWSNEGRHRPSTPDNFVFWPYITASNIQPAVVDDKEHMQGLRYFDVPPRISINFDAAQVRSIAFQGYPIEHGFHVNTLMSFEKNKINYADFENMQAYYDLAADHDGNPELHIRHRYFEANDPYNFKISTPTTIDEIRWSWNQSNGDGLNWDYKLGLAGRHTIDTAIQFPDFAYRAVPYDELPTWVLSHDWDYATFIAREQAVFQSSEGIYTWGAVEQPANGDPAALSRYLAGDIIVDVDQAFQMVPAGWRGDVARELGNRPFLYFSPVDRELHLLHASSGVWNIDDRSFIHYNNLDGDAYLDRLIYTHLATGTAYMTETKQLDISKDHLIYIDDTNVLVRRATVQPSLFELQPPINQQQWMELEAKLSLAHRAFAPGDFQAMLDQFTGPTLRISGARLRDYRPLGARGFRFVLELYPGFQAQGDDLLGVRGLPPDTYAVSYDGAFHVAPLTPPSLLATVSSAPLTALEQHAIEVRLDNAGLQDVPEATLELWAAQPGSEATMVATHTVSLLSQTPTTVRLPWAPPQAGAWRLTPRLRLPDSTISTFDPVVVSVQPAPAANTGALAAASAWPATLLLVAIVLVACAGLGALTVWRGWPMLQPSEGDDA